MAFEEKPQPPAEEDEDDAGNILEQSLQEENKKRAAWRIQIDKFLESYFVVGYMSLITVYSLFFDDIRVLAVTVEAD
jgi:hypothetical protein